MLPRCAAPDSDAAQDTAGSWLSERHSSVHFFSGRIVGLGFSAVKMKLVALASFVFWEDAYIEGFEIFC